MNKLLPKLKSNIWSCYESYTDSLTRLEMYSQKILGEKKYDVLFVERRLYSFLDALCHPDRPWLYRHTKDIKDYTLYASVYGVLLRNLLSENAPHDVKLAHELCDELDKAQNAEDGLFYDPVIKRSELYNGCDWWGARHFALHAILVYEIANRVPRYRFKFLDRYCLNGGITSWLGTFDWRSPDLFHSDLDNAVMNVVCLIQYERRIYQCEKSAEAVDEAKNFLKSKLNSEFGVWGSFDVNDGAARSRAVQFAYHLLPIFFHEGDYEFELDSICDLVLATQNSAGGFGVRINSSACEDIDSIDILRCLKTRVCASREREIEGSLARARQWVSSNQAKDGGFVFRRNEMLKYGDVSTSARANSGALFPSWFRYLSLIIIDGKKAPKPVEGYYYRCKEC